MNSIAFQVKLESDTIHLDNVNSFIGKDVMITIVEMPVQNNEPVDREWKFVSTAEFSQNIDQINIRDFAYE